MGRAELTAEALTQLIAGSDTTSKYVKLFFRLGRHADSVWLFSSSSAITYHLASNPEVQRKLQAELDEALGPHSTASDTVSLENAVAPFDIVKSLPYLEAVINEGLRIHSTRYVSSQ